MRLKLLLGFLLFVFLSLPVHAAEGDIDMEGVRTTLAEHQHDIDWDGTEQNVFIELYSTTGNIQPGGKIPLVIEQIMRPHWHTYWKNPGDSGEFMKSDWKLPEGFSLSELEWPTPQQIPFDPLVNFGYEGNALLYQELQAPETLPNGAFTVSVRFDILVCKEICIPESVEKKIILNSSLTNADLNIVNSDFVKEARSLMPIKHGVHIWDSKMYEQGDMLVLDITTDNSEEGLKTHNLQFFPNEYGLTEPSAKPEITITGNRILFKQKRAKFTLDRIKDKGGVFVLVDKNTDMRFGYEIQPELIDAPANAVTTSAAKNTEKVEFTSAESLPPTLFHAMLFAIIGGLILNLMPCVFPVLSMKALSLSKISEKSKTEAQKHGIAYTAGIILSMLAIAGLLIALQAGGSSIGWGFHLQNPVVILMLAYLFFVIGLNLSGYFEFGTKLMGIGQGGQKTEGVTGSFMTGILATIVATPCTAPFMATALGYALVQPAYIGLLVFASLGFGLALPYLLISFIPALQKAMPKPGLWMVTFKEFLAFPMFGAVIWLLWILTQQTGLNGIAMPLIGLLGITFTLWLFRHADLAQGGKKIVLMLMALAILGGSLLSSIYYIQMVDMVKEQPMPEFGETYSAETLETALSSDRPVFVEMTAAWCVTCKVNHYRAIDIPQTHEIMDRRNVSYLVGDWTNQDAEITKYLNKFGRNGVPIYIYYGRPDPATGKRPAPEMLPQLLSPSIVAETLDR